MAQAAAKETTMRMIVLVDFPVEPFNTLVRDGTAGAKIQKVLEDVKPEAVYFSERDGMRGAVLVVDVPEPSHIPALAEPFFLTFNATVKIRIAMTAEDIAKSGLDAMGQKYGA
jgi:hypothetical protein